MPQSQQQTQDKHLFQEEQIRMSIGFPSVEGTSEKLWCILRSHKIRSTLYTENTMCKLLSKLEDWVSTKAKKNVYEINCSNFEVAT